jgi:hypothetical protein
VVPSDYHPFFSASVGAAGALIGLLFVAISIVPHKLAGENASTGFQIKAGMAFSALINALVFSLYALLPGENLAVAGFLLAIVGISSTLGLALIALRDGELRSRRASLLVRFAGLLVLYSLQMIESLALGSRPHDSAPVPVDCTLVVICFLIAIDRAWELLGASDGRLTRLAGRALAQRRTRARSAGEVLQAGTAPAAPAADATEHE